MSQTDDPDPPVGQSPSGPRADRDVDADRDRLLDGSPVGRRTLMKGIGASAAGAVALGSDHGMVDDAEAIAPIVIGGAIAGAAVVGWAVREYEVVGSNPPAEGQTAGALKQKVYETARTRKSTNASTFVDNRNIISSGLPNTLYVEGKTAAIEALNAEKSQSEVETAALNAMKKYASTIEKNLLKSWNESVNEYHKLLSTVESHSEITAANVLPHSGFEEWGYPTEETRELTLTDDTTFQMNEIHVARDGGHDQHLRWDPTGVKQNNLYDETHPTEMTVDTGAKTVSWMNGEDWGALWTDLQDVISNVESGLTTWVSNVYGDVQSGSIDISELITPRQRAEMMAEDSGQAQAIADLAALNIPVDVGNKYTLTFADTGATLRGTLALTDDSQAIESGSTYNPSADTFTGDAFFTYDVSEGSGDWSAYQEGIDGGVATFTEAPYEETRYELTTSKNETVVVTRDNFTAVDSSGNEVEPHNSSVDAWEVDLSDQLENDIANLTGVDFFAATDESKMEGIQLRSEFTVEKIEDAESGEEVDSANFESSEPQNDTNYITEEEWEQLEKQNQELIEKYEASQSTGGGGIDLSQFDMFGLPGEIVALGAAGVGALLYGNSS